MNSAARARLLSRSSWLDICTAATASVGVMGATLRQEKVGSDSRTARLDEAPKLLVPNELVLKPGETRIETARIRHDEHDRSRDGLRFGPGTTALFETEERRVQA